MREAEGQPFLFDLFALFNPETSVLIQRRHATLNLSRYTRDALNKPDWRELTCVACT